MTENQIDQRNQKSDSESNQESAQNNSTSIQDKSNVNVEIHEKGEDVEEVKEETTFQRRPQFRLEEINKRKYF